MTPLAEWPSGDERTRRRTGYGDDSAMRARLASARRASVQSDGHRRGIGSEMNCDREKAGGLYRITERVSRSVRVDDPIRAQRRRQSHRHPARPTQGEAVVYRETCTMNELNRKTAEGRMHPIPSALLSSLVGDAALGRGLHILDVLVKGAACRLERRSNPSLATTVEFEC
jgi:hypothetical protein